MPIGRIKFFDPEKEFGFINGEDGTRVYLHASLLPADVPSPRPGTRVEYGVAEGRRGPQAISVRFLDDSASAQKAHRRKPQDMVMVVEDLIKLLDASSDSLRRGRYPENSKQIAKVLRAVADDFGA
ncbi:cold shock domain-containing protein [Actinomycetaceae bacterium MB13-C1-2]|nr:cold shock domain-containing protein [Actinomycetaceae bacterium MB13-C1-2]